MARYKKEYTREERDAYYKGLRARWAATKEIAERDGDAIRAIMSERGLMFSVRSYVLIDMQMKAAGLSGYPYIDMKTFEGWRAAGFIVKRGEKSTADGIVWITSEGREVRGYNGSGENGGGEDCDGVIDERRSSVYPKVYKLFHKSQVEEIESAAA
jgi:hypothetical protein